VSSGRSTKAVGRLHSAPTQKVGGGTSEAASLVSERSASRESASWWTGATRSTKAIEKVVAWHRPQAMLRENMAEWSPMHFGARTVLSNLLRFHEKSGLSQPRKEAGHQPARPMFGGSNRRVNRGMADAVHASQNNAVASDTRYTT